MDALLLDIEPAAAMVGVGRSTFYKLMDSGEIRTVRIGRRRLIERAELDRFVGQLRQRDSVS
jgi:excisionase family DNA binding protein